ncbi:MAG: hypothetical protein AB3N10_04155 [Allomuricauda sp.]
MKNIFNILSLSLITLFGLQAQNTNPGQLNASLNKTFTIQSDGTKTIYNIKVMEHRNYPVQMDDMDKGKVNQDRETSAAKVTKLIAVDTNNDDKFDQYFVLKYRKSITDKFEVIPTADGFAVKVDDQMIQHFKRDGIYFINNDDQDFFTVEEFREIV